MEEIATRRDLERSPLAQSSTNELLKSIPSFRERQGRLFICATNFIRDLDVAFLRHGRFDYVIPIGLPDAAAREAIWRRYLPVGADLDVVRLAAASERFSPADIEFAARKAAQRAFDTAIAAGVSQGAHGIPVVRTEAYLEAIAGTRPTVSETVLSEFHDDIRSLART